MDQKEILKHVDHTQLRAFATWGDSFCMYPAMLHQAGA